MARETPAQLDTPAMRQYRAFKDQYPDYILLFRMGDFYEMFYEDAKTASRVLGLALTSRSKGPTAVPLAGIPYHALDSYLARLIKAGHRVAICEQVEDPKQAKGLVQRDVTRLVTPGTLTDEHLLEQREGNYLAGLFTSAQAGRDAPAGLAWVELSSGAFWAMTVPADHVLDELVRIRPAEVVFPEGGGFDTPAWRDELKQVVSAAATSRPAWAFAARAAGEALQEHFGTATLAGFGFDGWDESLSAAGGVIEYLRETQRTALAHIGSLRPFDRADHMVIDGNTLRCLEVHRTLRTNRRAGSLLACIDRTTTGMGARLLERWLTFPLTSYSAIVARHDAVEELAADRARLGAVRDLLAEIAQIDRIAANIALARVRPRELVALGNSLRLLPAIADALRGCAADRIVQLTPHLTGMDASAELVARAIDPACPNVIRDGGVIAGGFNEELDRLRVISTEGRNWLAVYQVQQARATGIGSLKVGYNKVFGYYIEVTHAHRDKVPDSYVRKQTLKNAERYITDELKRYESDVLTAAERANALEARLFEEVRSALAENIPAFQAAAEAAATLDVLAALAQLAVERNYRRPGITQDNVLRIVGGRHPVLAEMLREQFVPNDLEMGPCSDRLLIITGPNMSGKSTYIRQAALLVLLAQAGSFIPVEEATIGLVDRIFTRVGAADELTRGLSTFMLEMVETANILNNATSRSLVVLDEVGRGTSTYDGLALAWAITEHIANKTKCRTLFATHYHELTELAELFTNVKNCNVAVREWADEVVFLHKILPGGTDKSYGIHVAKLAGVPKSILERSKEILEELESTFQKEATGEHLSRHKTKEPDKDSLFVQKHKSVLDKLASTDINNLTPLEAINLLEEIRREIHNNNCNQ